MGHKAMQVVKRIYQRPRGFKNKGKFSRYAATGSHGPHRQGCLCERQGDRAGSFIRGGGCAHKGRGLTDQFAHRYLTVRDSLNNSI